MSNRLQKNSLFLHYEVAEWLITRFHLTCQWSSSPLNSDLTLFKFLGLPKPGLLTKKSLSKENGFLSIRGDINWQTKKMQHIYDYTKSSKAICVIRTSEEGIMEWLEKREECVTTLLCSWV